MIKKSSLFKLNVNNLKKDATAVSKDRIQTKSAVHFKGDVVILSDSEKDSEELKPLPEQPSKHKLMVK